MFSSAEESIDHYNSSRVSNDKGLTIASQKRYVKFFQGFLTYELFLKDSGSEFPRTTHIMQGGHRIKVGPEEHDVDWIQKMGSSWFSMYLKKYNKIEENMVLRELKKKSLKFASFTLGPFPQRHSTIKIFMSHWVENLKGAEECKYATPYQE